jgi:3-phosphoshikimate 1-carboxyvinyltransferase
LPDKLNDLDTAITISQINSIKGTASLLPASKSISNRVLIMNALSGKGSELSNLSDANDTQLMLRLVSSSDEIIDVEDAGTTMRFLTAYFAVTNQKKMLTGTSRMKERPIGLLVDALRVLGADISYVEKDGFPPLKLNGFKGQKVHVIPIRGDVSSQYISALMMIAPSLPQGLTLNLEGKVGSKPYIEMTRSLMKEFGVKTSFEGNTITIEPQSYSPIQYTVESDWSGASYWFALVALTDQAEIVLPRISLDSLQGDRTVVDIMTNLGVSATPIGNHLLKLTKRDSESQLSWDFTHCPDLAQTIAVVCAAKGVDGFFTGLESLRIKETDRIAALQNELRKIGADLTETSGQWKLVPSRKLPSSASFNTYKDHRMAMAFAPLAAKMEVEIENPLVVRKSYPRYWDDLKNVGVKIKDQGN